MNNDAFPFSIRPRPASARTSIFPRPAASILQHILFGVIACALLATTPAQAEYCWAYDDQQALTKFACSGPPPASQTVWEKHEDWHDCFGAIGTDAPQPFRGQRFIAFHRQMIQEFNIDREDAGLDKIETWDAGQGSRITLPYPACANGFDRNCDNNSDGDCVDPGDDEVLCEDCVDLPPCFTVNTDNTDACPPYGYTNLDEFANADEIGIALDAGDDAWHASFHIGVGDTDGDPDTAGAQTCTDIDTTADATGEPMFWRAHQKLDDVLTDWQVRNAVDVVLVVDRSGSMAATVPDGDTKFDKAVEAAELYAAMVRGSTNGSENRIGLVSFSNTASNELALTDSTAAISADGTSGPLLTALGGIGTGGSTSIGDGVENALCMLCPDADGDGDCQSDDCESASGNPRKAILLLSDGLENTEPCLEGSDTPCVGDEISYEGTAPYRSLGYTQVCAVGYGEESALDGDLLTALAEQQGGIYVSGASGDDLKEFFAKCYGELTSEFTALDPKGRLAADQLASETFSYNTCQDSAATFVLGWQQEITEGDIRLEIQTPSGKAVDMSDPTVRTDIDSTWHFAKIGLPYQGEGAGQWNARVIRPHRSFVNGFVSDAFVDHKAGVDLVRTQIQRLCNDSCKHVLYYEDGSASGQSVYADALKAESGASVMSVTRASEPDDFNNKLNSEQRWDLIVYANQMHAGGQSYDPALQARLCRQEQPAIVTDNRRADTTAALFKCLDAARTEDTNMDRLVGSGRLNTASLKLENNGYNMFTYGLDRAGPGDPQALFYKPTFAASEAEHISENEAHTHKHSHSSPTAAVVAGGATGEAVDWFANITADSHSRLDVHRPQSNRKTGDTLKPSVRITESFRPIDGYDKVVARVEITPPKEGVGNQLMKNKYQGDESSINGDPQSARETAFRRIPAGDADHQHPQTYRLYDDGTHGDNFPNNYYWTAEIPGIATVDGNYTYRFIVDITKDGCTQRREVAQTVYVGLGVDPDRSRIDIEQGAGGGWDITVVPRDQYGNYWGPGRPGRATCGSEACEVLDIVDHDNGAYTIRINTGSESGSVNLDAFDTRFDIPLVPTTGPDGGVDQRLFWLVIALVVLLMLVLWWCCCRQRHRTSHG